MIHQTKKAIIHSDTELGQKMEPAIAPQTGPSNTELVNNSHQENGASPVLDGNVKHPERQNVNAIREAIETQAEMEVGKNIDQKQKEVTVAEEVRDEKAMNPNSTEVTAKPGTQIIINVASEVQAEGIGGEYNDKITSGHGGGMFGGTDLLGPKFHVGFTLKGSRRGVNFSSLKAAQIFINEATTKFGKVATTWTMKCAGPVDETQRQLVLELLKQKPHTTSEIEISLGGGKYSMTAYPILQELAAEGLVKHKQMRWHLKTANKTAEYEGWKDWQTDTINIYIDQERATNDRKRDLTEEALMNGDTVAQLAERFRTEPMFQPMYRQVKREYEEANTDSRDERGAYEGRQLRGEKLPSTGNHNADIMNQLWDFRHEMSGGETPWEDPDWVEIAQASMDERLLNRDNRLRDQPDEDLAQSMGIKMTSNKKKFSVWKKKAFQIETRVSEGKPDPIPMIVRRLNEHFMRIKKQNPKGYLDSFEMQLDKYMFEVAQELNLKISIGPDGAYVLADDFSSKARTRVEALPKGAAGEVMAKTKQDIEKEAGFNFFFPGQVLKEFYPEIQHEIVDYPNASNSPMGLHAPEMVGDGGHELEGVLDEALDTSLVEAIQLPGDVSELHSHAAADYSSTSPAGAMGIGRDGKPQVLEGAPLRKENDIRGTCYTDEYFGQYQGVPGAALAVVSSFKKEFLGGYKQQPANNFLAKKVAAEDEAKQFSLFLKKVCGEIAATFIGAFRVTHRPLLDKVPGVGEIQLAQVEMPQGMSNFNAVGTGSRVKYLLDKLNDGEIKEAINDSWAQAAVWNDEPSGGFVYEVFVRIETIDTDSMLARYKYVCGTRE
jgi:predicted transcriptional regulator